MENGSFVNVFQSEVVKNNLNPNWRPISESAAKLCGGDLDRQLQVSVWDWDSNSDPDLIGKFEASLRDLSKPGASFDLVNPKKAAKKKCAL